MARFGPTLYDPLNYVIADNLKATFFFKNNLLITCRNLSYWKFVSTIPLSDKKLSYRRDNAHQRRLRRSRSFKVNDVGTTRN